MTFLYCYDIADAKRWRQICTRLEQLGFRIQKSIFQCDAPVSVHSEVIREMRALMDRREDSLRVYPICSRCIAKAEYEGEKPPIETAEYRIL